MRDARFFSAMRWKIRPTTEFVFVVSGVLIILMSWIADLLGALSVSPDAGHGSSSNLSLRLLLLFNGVGFALMGIVYEHHERFLKDGLFGIRYLAGYLIVTDGALHLFALNDHITEFWAASFFAVFAAVELLVGIMLPYLSRDLDPLWLWLIAFLIAVYVATRTMVVWPNTEVETVEGLDIVSKIVEVFTVLVLVQMLRKERALRLKEGQAGTKGSSPSQ